MTRPITDEERYDERPWGEQQEQVDYLESRYDGQDEPSEPDYDDVED